MNYSCRDQQELDSLLEAVFKNYGYDFRQYSRDSVWRRVRQRLREEQLVSLSELQRRVLLDKAAADALLCSLSINVTEMFRDPGFYFELRKKVMPLLEPLPHIKVWHAGCATGEEVYSMAIMLSEAGLYERSLLYATDFNNNVLDSAKKGILPLNQMQHNSSNYYAAGGKRSFADYYYSNYDAAILEPSLLKNIAFSHHNLATDGPHVEVQMIVCRNVLIYFNQELQQRVFRLFCESLSVGGVLCLGSHETLKLDNNSARFENISSKNRIFRRVE